MNERRAQILARRERIKAVRRERERRAEDARGRRVVRNLVTETQFDRRAFLAAMHALYPQMPHTPPCNPQSPIQNPK